MIRIDLTDSDGKYLDSVYNNDRGMTEARLQAQLEEYRKMWNGTMPDGKVVKDYYPTFASYLVGWAHWMPKPQSVFHFQVT